MKNMNKIFAILTIIVFTLSTIVNAANTPLDGATANITLSGNTTAETLTVTQNGKDFTADNVNLVEIKNNAGTIVYTNTSVTNANGSFTIVGNDFDTSLNNTTRYTIAFKTVSGDFGWAVLVINTDNTLTVTWIVLPVLTFALEASSKDFEVLTTNYKSISTGVEIWTNAANGVSVTAKSTNGGLKSTTAGHTIGLGTNDSLYSNESYQFQSVLWTADSVSGATIAGLSYTTVNTVNGEHVIYTANKPQNFDTSWDYDTDFWAQIKIAESTPAATDYSDTIVFTATWNF